jgi:glycerophosphoryl diester phosphodiesterase
VDSQKGKEVFLKVGHRGARAYEMENTLQSFQRSIELGANAIEMDVRRSKDGNLVIIHDKNLKRVFGKDAPVNQSTLNELEKLSGDKIPTLEEALEFVDKKVEKILLELKEVGYEKRILELIGKKRLKKRVIIISFHEQAVANIRQLDSKIETGLVYSRYRNPVHAALGLNAQYLVPFYRFIHTKNVADAHKNRLKVIAWTINTEQEAKEYRTKGVDGIASDKPDILSDVS